MATAVMIDGVLVPPGHAPRVVLDDGLVRGDGVFEGMRCYGRRPRTPDAHLERLARSAAAVAIPLDLDVLREELARFCAATSAPDCAVRLMVTRGGQRIWREEPLPVPRDAVRLLPVAHRVTPLLIGAKTLSYAANMQAARTARAAGYDDALFVRADDRVVLEGPVWSFGWLEGGVLTFPPLEVGVLDSITRRVASEALAVRERTVTVDELAGAEGAFVISTVMVCEPVAEVGGVVSLDPGAPRVLEVCAAIREAAAARA